MFTDLVGAITSATDGSARKYVKSVDNVQDMRIHVSVDDPYDSTCVYVHFPGEGHCHASCVRVRKYWASALRTFSNSLASSAIQHGGTQRSWSARRVNLALEDGRPCIW